MDVRTLMRRAASTYSGYIAVISGDRQLTFSEAWERGVQMANGLTSLGLRQGDRVAVLEDNCLEAQDFFAGTAAAGLVRVPLYARDSRDAHKHNLDHTQSRVLIVTPKYLEAVRGLDTELEHLEHIFVRDDTYEDWLMSQSTIDPDPVIDIDDLYIIRHTGGTTGRAKGVANTHRSWLAACRDWTYKLPAVIAGDTCLHAGPISHGSGYHYTPMWLSGACNYLLEEFEPVAVNNVIRDVPINYMFGVPTLFAMLAAQPGLHPSDFPHLKAMLVAGAPMTDRTAMECRDAFGPVFYQLYGQTEALPATVLTPEEWFGEIEGSTPMRSAGRVLPFAEIEIRGAHGEELPVGQEGDIAIRCEGQMTGYWGDPSTTAERLVEGWVLTGDIGRVDSNGFLYVMDRSDDKIISGGFNIWPAELESAISLHPAVQEVAVVGIPHSKWGETPLAVCVVDSQADVTEQEIIDLCASKLGSYKKPTEVVFTAEPLPKSVVGKLQRKALRDPYWVNVGRKI